MRESWMVLNISFLISPSFMSLWMHNETKGVRKSICLTCQDESQCLLSQQISVRELIHWPFVDKETSPAQNVFKYIACYLWMRLSDFETPEQVFRELIKVCTELNMVSNMTLLVCLISQGGNRFPFGRLIGCGPTVNMILLVPCTSSTLCSGHFHSIFTTATWTLE